MSKNSIHKIPITKWNGREKSDVSDDVVVEQPLEIRLSSGSIKHRVTSSIYITMRTPGEDEFLALGFLYTENVIQSFDQIYNMALLNKDVILVELKPEVLVNLKSHERLFSSTASCGICGKTSISSIHNHRYPIQHHDAKVSVDILYSLPNKIEKEQSVFNLTGGLHSASLFDLNGNLIAIFEDIGRHNAMDKLAGYMLRNKVTSSDQQLVFLSGRLGFELVHKTLKMGVSMLVAIGPPSNLSIEIAGMNNLCLIGFLKTNSLNVYNFPDRLEK